jgi:hypothetical protein
MRFGFHQGRGREHQHRDRVSARAPTVPAPSASASRRESSPDRGRGLATDHPAVVGARRRPPGRLDRVRDVCERQHRDHPRSPAITAITHVRHSIVLSTCRCRGGRARRGSRHRWSTTRTRWRSRRARGATAAVGCLATVRGRDADARAERLLRQARRRAANWAASRSRSCAQQPRIRRCATR